MLGIGAALAPLVLTKRREATMFWHAAERAQARYKGFGSRAVMLLMAAVAAHGCGDQPGDGPVLEPGPQYERVVTASANTIPLEMVVDRSGSAYVTGYTEAPDYPTTGRAYDRQCGSDGRCDRYPLFDRLFSDAFVTKLDASGAIAWSTFLGGSKEDRAHGIAADAKGRVYVTGQTDSTDFPVTAGPTCGYMDAFVARLRADGSALEYARCFGGEGDKADVGWTVAADAAGAAFATGYTFSKDFPNVPVAWPLQAATDGPLFVLRISPDGTPQFAAGMDARSTASVVDGDGNVVVAGVTRAPGFPVVRPLQNAIGGLGDAAVVRIDKDGSRLLFSSYVGGAGEDSAEDVATTSDGHTYVVGRTMSPTFPTTLGAADRQCGSDGQCNNPLADAFAMALGPNDELEWSTFLGGSSDEAGRAICVDPRGRVLVSGDTWSLDFPLRDPLPNGQQWRPELGEGLPFLTAFDRTTGALLWSTLVPLAASRPSAVVGVGCGPDGASYVGGRVSAGWFVVKLPGTAGAALQ